MFVYLYEYTSNTDTNGAIYNMWNLLLWTLNGAEESVLFSEVSPFQRLKEYY